MREKAVLGLLQLESDVQPTPQVMPTTHPKAVLICMYRLKSTVRVHFHALSASCHCANFRICTLQSRFSRMEKTQIVPSTSAAITFDLKTHIQVRRSGTFNRLNHTLDQSSFPLSINEFDTAWPCRGQHPLDEGLRTCRHQFQHERVGAGSLHSEHL